MPPLLLLLLLLLLLAATATTISECDSLASGFSYIRGFDLCILDLMDSGGCAGKPPLLSWSVWGVYNETADKAFLEEMYPIIDGFHRFWYHHRDTLGVGLCSWTGGMESGACITQPDNMLHMIHMYA